MYVREVMTSAVVAIAPDQSIGTAVRLMKEGGFRRLPVVEDGKLVGIVTDRDLRLATNSPLVLREKWYSDFILESIKVKSCMTANPITIMPDASVLEAVKLMRGRKIGGLPVVAELDGELVGVVTTTDLLDFLISLLEQLEADVSMESTPAAPADG